MLFNHLSITRLGSDERKYDISSADHELFEDGINFCIAVGGKVRTIEFVGSKSILLLGSRISDGQCGLVHIACYQCEYDGARKELSCLLAIVKCVFYTNHCLAAFTTLL